MPVPPVKPKPALPDRIGRDCRVLFVGINPGLRSAALGHHFAGHGNRFWKLLNASGLVDTPLGPDDDVRLPELGLGLTNVAARPTRGSGDLGSSDFAAGRAVLLRKVRRFGPQVVVFVGITAFRAYFEERGAVVCGARPERIGRARVFVLPNPSGRNAHYDFDRMLEAWRALADSLRSAEDSARRAAGPSD
ncbi:MAG: mismatch-specific DNA-glycosylase [Planctomycetes bacterium]|nr:mismatch-specific DNA-glycosylase [Planctomycetota bacterium]